MRNEETRALVNVNFGDKTMNHAAQRGHNDRVRKSPDNYILEEVA